MPKPGRRPRIVGPFFLLALLASALVFVWQRQQTARSLTALPPPVVEHQVKAGALGMGSSEAPPDFLSAHATELRLTAAQRQQLAPIVAEYRQRLAPLQRQMEVAVRGFERYRQDQQSARRVSVADVQEHMGEISALSGQMAQLRLYYRSALEGFISPQQRRQARELWGRSLQARTNQGARPK